MMKQRDITLQNGRTISFEVMEEAGMGMFFVLGVRKSGSSILNSMCQALAGFRGYNYVDVGGAFFDSNVKVFDWATDVAVCDILAEGNVYGGFRDMPFSLGTAPLFQLSKKVLLVRDPRDALVSQYFSSSYSHKIPEVSEGEDDVVRLMIDGRRQALTKTIDEVVLVEAPMLNRTMVGFKKLLVDERCLILKYEREILKKAEMLKRISSHFGWPVVENEINLIMQWADVVPQSEDPRAFIRRVVPGDHVEKLAPATIGKLDEILRPSMSLFGY